MERNPLWKEEDEKSMNVAVIFAGGIGRRMKNFKRAGILMLGNKGFKLPCGEYILEEELQNALEEYVFSNERKDEKPKSSEEFFKHLEGEEITLKPSDVKVLDIDEKNIKNQNNEDILNKFMPDENTLIKKELQVELIINVTEKESYYYYYGRTYTDFNIKIMIDTS